MGATASAWHRGFSVCVKAWLYLSQSLASGKRIVSFLANGRTGRSMRASRRVVWLPVIASRRRQPPDLSA
ncbi:hypothetical protein M2337_000133 [Sphingobium sp. B2D3A]|nr:hypothetical protein [Sphingobium sp. B2D3A]MCW2385659.1 hypothetical protein [Sphingobium sp. B2D3D]